VVSDAAGSLAAILAAVLILGWGLRRADSLISVLLAHMMFWGAWKLVVRTVDVLMESTPRASSRRARSDHPGDGRVADLHDLHAWTISEGFDVVTVHVTLDGTRHGTDVSREVSERIRAEHGIARHRAGESPPSTDFYQPVSP
jgi:cobalt-zinc-cadmium efflux system protein